jgi:hypothetical protein
LRPLDQRVASQNPNPPTGCEGRLESQNGSKERKPPERSAPTLVSSALENNVKPAIIRSRHGRKLPKTHLHTGAAKYHGRARLAPWHYSLLVLALGGLCWLLTAGFLHVMAR